MKGIMKYVVIILAVVAIPYHTVNADPVNIEVEGKVVAAPCIVNNNVGSLDVNLGSNIKTADLATANSGSTLKPFNIVLSNCPTGTKNVTVVFTGDIDDDAPTMYKNTGTAENIAVELSEQGSDTILSNKSELTQPVLADKTVTFALNARAYTVTGDVGPGNITAVVQATFSYN